MVNCLMCRSAAALLLASGWLAGAQKQTLRYQMRGEVRPLLFWFGKDRVGGGTVSVSGEDGWTEAEILFGSDPDRVPGRVSRWGYGKERAEYKDGRLSRTLFEGFMRHSNEESMSQVASNNKENAAGQSFLYDAIRSEVLPERAHSEIRVFAEQEEVHYTNPEVLQAKYRSAIASRPADRQRTLENRPPKYQQPYGFLTALLELTRQVAASQVHGETSRAYAYNGQLYRLTLKRVKITGSNAAADFETFNTQKNTRTAFTLTIPLEGAHRGLPVRIVMQPRWWLRLRLDLIEAP